MRKKSAPVIAKVTRSVKPVVRLSAQTGKPDTVYASIAEAIKENNIQPYYMNGKYVQDGFKYLLLEEYLKTKPQYLKVASRMLPTNTTIELIGLLKLYDMKLYDKLGDRIIVKNPEA